MSRRTIPKTDITLVYNCSRLLFQKTVPVCFEGSRVPCYPRAVCQRRGKNPVREVLLDSTEVSRRINGDERLLILDTMYSLFVNLHELNRRELLSEMSRVQSICHYVAMLRYFLDESNYPTQRSESRRRPIGIAVPRDPRIRFTVKYPKK